MNRFVRSIVLFVSLACCVAGGAVAAQALTAGGGQQPLSPIEGANYNDPTAAAVGTDTIEQSRQDPGGGPPWAVRAYTNLGGVPCTDIGREVDGKIGALHADGSFTERRLVDGGGNCGDVSKATGIGLAVTAYPDDPTTPGHEPERTTVHGMAGPHVRAVTVKWPDGDEALSFSRRQAFIAVHRDLVGTVPILVTYDDGVSKQYELSVPGV